MPGLRVVVFIGGIWIVTVAINSAIRSLVLPRSAQDPIARLVFISLRRLFALRIKRARSYAASDSLMAMYAPVSLMALLPVWLALVLVGYSLMFWSAEEMSWYQAFRASGSSLLTLGFTAPEGWLITILEFSEATLGLILVALLIAYLPTMYSGFARRESSVTLLEVRAGDPPWAVTMLERYQRIHGLERLSEEWRAWEVWFAEVEESHTSLPALAFFRSPQPNHSWVTAAGAVLDSASLYLAAVDLPFDPQAALCIRGGYLALQRISDYFNIKYNPNPRFPDEPITITRQEFDAALDRLETNKVPLIADREQAWRDFAGWRVNYDKVLVSLARLTMAPESPWSGDRTESMILPPVFNRKG